MMNTLTATIQRHAKMLPLSAQQNTANVDIQLETQHNSTLSPRCLLVNLHLTAFKLYVLLTLYGQMIS